jgi:trehalose utilization protein
MKHHYSRREFLKTSSVPVVVALSPCSSSAEAPTVRVVVWDEQQPAQKEVYSNFLGNEFAAHLKRQPDISVESVCLNDPGQGLAGGVLDRCDVLIWWGHVRNGEIKPEVGQSIVKRIKAGTLSLIALHSAHWSTPFVEAMYERTRIDFAKKLHDEGKEEGIDVVEVPPSHRYTVPKATEPKSPYVSYEKLSEKRQRALLQLPYCCFPAYRNDGKPSRVRVLRPEHPVVAGIPREFELPHTEMYNEPFHVPEPDEVILEERWATGEWFRSGMIWKLGKGRVFYFRPGHETFAIYKEAIPLQILTNAARWLAAGGS